MLAEEGEKFEVWVANPNEAQSEGWIRQQLEPAGVDVAHVGYSTRKQYLESLWQSDIVPILYPQSHIYSLGYCEAIEADNMVLEHSLPGYEGSAAWYIEEVTPELIAKNLGEMFSWWRDRGEEVEYKLAMQRSLLRKDRSVEENIDKVKATIEEVT
jgi:hypothetical protein